MRDVKGQVVFFQDFETAAAGNKDEKISTLKPLTSRIFAVPFRCRQRGTGFHPAPAVVRSILRQNRLRWCGANHRLCRGSAPAPPASSKEQNKQNPTPEIKGVLFIG